MLRGEQVHHRGRVRRTDAEIDDRKSRTISRCLHRAIFAVNMATELFGKLADVGVEIRQQHVFAKLAQRHPGVAGEPILGKFYFCYHRNSADGQLGRLRKGLWGYQSECGRFFNANNFSRCSWAGKTPMLYWRKIPELAHFRLWRSPRSWGRFQEDFRESEGYV